MKNNFYWLYLENYVYLNIKSNEALLYNTLDGMMITTKSKKVITLLQKINNNKNPYVVRIDDSYLSDYELSSFIAELQKHFMGDFYNTNYTEKKPIQLISTIRDISSIKEMKDINVSKHLERVKVHLNSSPCNLKNISVFKNAWKQVLFPKSSINYKELNIDYIKEILPYIKDSQKCMLTIISPDIFKYSSLSELLMLLKEIKPNVELVTHFNVFINEKNSIITINKILKNFSRLNIILDSFYTVKDIKQIIKSLKDINYTFSFIVRSDIEVKKTESIIQNLNIKNFILVPFYDKTNMNFFVENVFLDINSIKYNNISMKEILLNTIINRYKYGEIIIDPDGNVYSDINTCKLGNIKNSSLLDMIVSEIAKGKSWKLRRNKVNPCKKCIYCNICPPISNYENTIGKYNLCNIYKIKNDTLQR